MSDASQQERREAAEEALDLSQVELDSIDLEESRERLAATKDGVRKQAVMDLLTISGRVQGTEFINQITKALAINQLLKIKELCGPANITWKQACKLIGISTQRADQRIRQAKELGDEFVANSERLGVSFRALETARALPEPVKQKLVSGEVVDLSQVTKEELTEVIKDLSRESAKALASKDEALTKESKAKEKAEAKSKEAQQRLEATAKELANLRAGLPEDDEEAMQIIRDIEGKILPHLAVIMMTKMQGRSPKAVARITTSLELIRAQAEWAHQRLCLMAAGEEFDDAELNEEARHWADEIEASGERRPVI